MTQCVSDSNPHDDEPDVVEEAEKWLKRHPDKGDRYKGCYEHYPRVIIEGLLEYIEENV